MNIGKGIVKIRKQKRIKQKELAIKCEIVANGLCLIEKGISYPQKGTLQRIANELEVPVAYIFLAAIEKEDIPEGKRKAFSMLHEEVLYLIQK